MDAFVSAYRSKPRRIVPPAMYAAAIRGITPHFAVTEHQAIVFGNDLEPMPECESIHQRIAQRAFLVVAIGRCKHAHIQMLALVLHERCVTTGSMTKEPR